MAAGGRRNEGRGRRRSRSSSPRRGSPERPNENPPRDLERILELVFYPVTRNWNIGELRFQVFFLDGPESDVQVTVKVEREGTTYTATWVSSQWPFDNVYFAIMRYTNDHMYGGDYAEVKHRVTTTEGQPCMAEIAFIKRPLREQPEQARDLMEELFGSDAEGEGGEEHVEGDNS